jgi:predicted ATP-dependent endonuclease of OLD family
MLSTQSRANKIHERDIILIDEPDQSLYPTSARYLRDELLEMGKKSKILYSTHSQYMIDSNCLERHYVVEKKDDITTLKKENGNAPYSNDELLRRAIGSSIFECLQEKNIIFEGWLDKELFNKHCEYQKKSKDVNNIGISYLAGISGVETLVTLLLLANKKFIIVADSDETSNNKRKEFVKNYPEHKDSWIAYADIVKGTSTMEDFLEENHIQNHIKLKGNNTYIYDSTKNAILNIEKAGYKDKDSKQEIKNQLIANLSKEVIKTDYVLFVDAVKQKITSL